MARTILALLATATLAACGSDRGASGWAGADACRVMAGSQVGAILDGRVAEQEVSAVREGADSDERFAQCTYTLANGRMAIVGTGLTDADGAALIASYRSQISAAGGKPVDMPGVGVGRGAQWSDMLRALDVVLGDERYLIVNVMPPPLAADRPSTAKEREAAIKFARTLGA